MILTTYILFKIMLIELLYSPIIFKMMGRGDGIDNLYYKILPLILFNGLYTRKSIDFVI